EAEIARRADDALAMIVEIGRHALEGACAVEDNRRLPRRARHRAEQGRIPLMPDAVDIGQGPHGVSIDPESAGLHAKNAAPSGNADAGMRSLSGGAAMR